MDREHCMTKMEKNGKGESAFQQIQLKSGSCYSKDKTNLVK